MPCRCLPVFVLAVLLLPGTALAHDLWLASEGDGYLLQYGHRGGELLPLNAAKLKTIHCRQKGGAMKDLALRAGTPPTALQIPGKCEAVTAFLYGGFYSLTPDGEKNQPRSQVPDAVRSWESRQYAKWIDVHAQSATAPLGEEFEIVPASDLARAKQGDKATFRILLHGKPAAGVALAMDHKVLGESDSKGEVRVRIRGAAFESVVASLRQPLQSPDADTVVYEASLSFEVAR